MAQKTTAEFRDEAVLVALTSGPPRNQVAADFGIGFYMLSRWIQKDRRHSEKPTVQSDLERDITELRKENRMRREERKVSTKATVFFAERSKRGLPSLKNVETTSR